MRKFKVFAHSNCVRRASASGFYGLPAAGALVRFLTDARAAIDNHARPKVGRARTRPTRPVPAGLLTSTVHNAPASCKTSTPVMPVEERASRVHKSETRQSCSLASAMRALQSTNTSLQASSVPRVHST